jgi:hypothetical protein
VVVGGGRMKDGGLVLRTNYRTMSTTRSCSRLWPSQRAVLEYSSKKNQISFIVIFLYSFMLLLTLLNKIQRLFFQKKKIPISPDTSVRKKTVFKNNLLKL